MSEEEAMRIVARKVEANIAQAGWHAQSVIPSAGTYGYAYLYTIGLGQNFGHPELVVIGMDAETAFPLTIKVVGIVRSGAKLPLYVRIENVLEGLDVMLTPVPADDLPEWFAMGLSYYAQHLDTPMRVVQIVWPDASNRFPWEPGFDEGYATLTTVLCPPA